MEDFIGYGKRFKYDEELSEDFDPCSIYFLGLQSQLPPSFLWDFGEVIYLPNYLTSCIF